MRTAVFLVAFISYSSFGFQSPQASWRKSAIERPGLHHANIRGRLLSPGDKPVAGIHVQLNTGNFRDLPSAEAISDQAGRFAFLDINSAVFPNITWQSADWLRGSMGIPGESGDDVELGDIHLVPDTVIRVALELVGGTPLDEKTRHPTVVLANAGGQGPRIVAEEIGGLYFLRQIPFTDGTWDVSLYVNRRAEKYSGSFHVDHGRRDQLLMMRLMRDTVKPVNQNSNQGKMELSEALTPEQSPDREFHIKGTFHNPDGSPLAGAVVSVNEFILRRSIPAWTTSGADGSFELSYSASACLMPRVDIVLGRVTAWTPELYAANDETCDKQWSQPRQLTLASASHLFLNPTGNAPPKSIHASWWHSSLGWLSFATLDPWMSSGFVDNKPIIKLEADGYLPVVKAIQVPNVNARKNEKPPERLDESFPFDSSATRELRVTAGGKPAPSATVDLEWIQNLEKGTHIPLATYRTDAEGKLRLIGDPPQQIVEAFVYVPGSEPRRAIWNAGEPLVLDLAPRKSRLTFTQLRPGQVVRIHSAEHPEAVRTLICDYGKPAELPIAAGAYDLVIYSQTGQVVSNQRVTITEGETRAVDVTVDQRPKLIVQHQEEGWTTTLTTSTPSGMPFGWSIYSNIGGGAGRSPIADIVSVLESESPQQSVYRLSHAGRAHIQIARTGKPHFMWREIEVNPGQTLTVAVPKLDATLQGSMRTYDGGKGFSEHGWAGPRFEMISDDPSGWSVTVFMPPRDGEHSFTMASLPAGEYHLYQHLIGKLQSYKDDKGQEHPFTVTVDAWGGIPVKLSPNGSTKLDDFIDYPYRDLAVTVNDGQGHPLRNATLRVRDRMSDAWRQIAEGPTTLSYAMHPIPYPPAIRLEDGKATLPSIRSGRLELQVELDDGRIFPFTAEVDAKSALTLTLANQGGAR